MKRIAAIFAFAIVFAPALAAQEFAPRVDVTLYGGIGFWQSPSFVHAEGTSENFTYDTLVRRMEKPINASFIPFMTIPFGFTVAYPLRENVSIGLGYGAQFFMINTSSLKLGSSDIVDNFYSPDGDLLSARTINTMQFDYSSVWTHSIMARARFRTDKVLGPLALYGGFGAGVLLPSTQETSTTREYRDYGIANNEPNTDAFTNTQSTTTSRVSFNPGFAVEGEFGLAIPINNQWSINLGVRSYLASVLASVVTSEENRTTYDHTGVTNRYRAITNAIFEQTDELYREKLLRQEGNVAIYGYTDRNGNEKVTRRVKTEMVNGVETTSTSDLVFSPYSQFYSSIDIVLSVSVKF